MSIRFVGEEAGVFKPSTDVHRIDRAAWLESMEAKWFGKDHACTVYQYQRVVSESINIAGHMVLIAAREPASGRWFVQRYLEDDKGRMCSRINQSWLPDYDACMLEFQRRKEWFQLAGQY